MISLDNLVSVEQSANPQVIKHYNLFRSAEINGTAAPGHSSGEGIAAMEALAKRVLPIARAAGTLRRTEGKCESPREIGGNMI